WRERRVCALVRLESVRRGCKGEGRCIIGARRRARAWEGFGGACSTRADEDAAREEGTVGEERVDEIAAEAVVDVHLRAAAGPRRGDDLVEAVAVELAHRHADAAVESGTKGIEGA